MSNKNKYREDIELFYEKTGEVVRLIHFKHPNEFYTFLEDFKSMKYPSYGWRYRDKRKNKENNE